VFSPEFVNWIGRARTALSPETLDVSRFGAGYREACKVRAGKLDHPLRLR
jgi:hypothetical protein